MAIHRGNYIGSAEHKQNLLAGMRDSLEIQKMVARGMHTDPEILRLLEEVRDGYKKLKMQADNIK